MYHSLGGKGIEGNIDALVETLTGGEDTKMENFSSMRFKKAPMQANPLAINLTDATKTASVTSNKDNRSYFGLDDIKNSKNLNIKETKSSADTNNLVGSSANN